ncbi:MAG: twin-arginine translocase TatA/TatE family subunit [Alphaproteobacteria bacterium]|nr:twin-arginine translocase TatA/TatE family subunit [Alphaproteobacteria bacterium]
MGIWHWLVVILVVLVLFGGSKVSDLMGDVAKGIKAFKKGLQEEDKSIDKPEATKSIEHNSSTTAETRNDIGSKAL